MYIMCLHYDSVFCTELLTFTMVFPRQNSWEGNMTTRNTWRKINAKLVVKDPRCQHTHDLALCQNDCTCSTLKKSTVFKLSIV